MFQQIAELNRKLNNLLYVNPVSMDIEIEGIGSCTFTSTNEVNDSTNIADGFVEVFAKHKTHYAIFDVNLDTMEISDWRLYEVDSNAIEKEYHDYIKLERGNTMA